VLKRPWAFNGRTELAAASGVLREHGFDPADRRLVEEFLQFIVEELHSRAAEMRRTGRVLLGAMEALIACAAVGMRQSVLTGNLFAIAALKTTTFGLDQHLDLRIGAYGGDAMERTDLVAHAWRRAGRHCGELYTGADTVIVGDTLLDVATGKAAGAHMVAVATGPATVAELRSAGADVVLADLSDTEAVMEALLG
jgi:phosphoglycolate phosphatase-like HAD superfamily hydrolase